jgi:hypothetical protein
MISRRRLLLGMLSGLTIRPSAAWAGADNPLRNRRERRVEVPDVAQFHRQDGRRGFILDRTGEVWLLKPLDEAEVLALTAQRAPGGGTSFVSDWGDEVIRVSSIGAVTYYPEDQPNGVIAEAWEPARPLRTPDAGVDELRDRSTRAAVELAELFGRPMQVEYGAAPRDGLGLMVEAFDLTVEGFRQAVGLGAELDGLQRVKIAPAEAADIEIEGDLFVVKVNPLGGYAGRPSSTRIARALLAASIPA